MASYNLDENKEFYTRAADEPTPVITVGVHETSASEAVSEIEFMQSMHELDELAVSCEMDPVLQMTQKLPHRSNATYIGKGKIEELKLCIEQTGAEMVLLNDTLTPSQLRNLQKELELPVMDRTALILEIFRSRARTREAKLQVEYARLGYIRTRLVGMWDTLGRKGGASGSMSSRGEGETQLELDRRAIDKRIAELRRELADVSEERRSQRKKRQKSGIPLVALTGYTNAGKSTIMNSLVRHYSASEEKQVFEANMLFATLDSTVRRIEPGNHQDFLLSDTVGFIHKLPTGLVEAFRSTLEEVAQADLLLHVVDCSDERHKNYMDVTQKTIIELGAGHIPQIVVYNKADLKNPPTDYPKPGMTTRTDNSELCRSIYICARETDSIDLLVQTVIEELYGTARELTFLFPYDAGKAVNELNEKAEVISAEYTGEGVLMKVSCTPDLEEKYAGYVMS